MSENKDIETVQATHEKREVFLVALAECGNVSRAAQIAEMNRTTLYRLRGEDANFRLEWDAAAEIGVEALEDEARRRAVEGWEEPVWYQGQMCGTVRKFSDTLLIVLLKAHKPDKYKENSKVEVDPKLPPKLEFVLNAPGTAPKAE